MPKPKPLDKRVEFDCPFRVHSNGTVTGEHTANAPEAIYDEKVEGPWELLKGYSGQDRYAGPVMHASEYLGGQMERDVLARPGVYVLLAAYWTPDREGDAEEGEDFVAEGWGLARLIEEGVED